MGAGPSSPSVLSVHSLDPEKDVQLLQQIFPDKFRVEYVDDTDTICLVGHHNANNNHHNNHHNTNPNPRLTVLLVASAQPSNVTWVVDAEEIRRAVDNRLSDKVVVLTTNNTDFTVAEILLAGNASIVMVPPEMLASSAGRHALARILSNNSNRRHGHDTCQVDVDVDVDPRNENENGDQLRDVELHPESAREKGESPEAEAQGASPEAVDDQEALLVKLESSNIPHFPSLQVGLLGKKGVFQPDFTLNSMTPIDIETELFQGRILIIVRPPNPEDDPYWNERIFSKRKRRLVIQIQGKFKYKPVGIVFAGAEVSEQMKLGMLVRGLCGMLLKLVDSYNSNVHYSFGDSKGLEKPHIVAPAYTFFERVVATPPEETPPPMDCFFEESTESINKRKASESNGEWNTTDTYSLSFYSMYIDLPTWKLVSLPVSGDISLKTFWGNSLLSICMYEKTGTEKQHLQQFNRYCFAVQTKFVDPGLQSQTNDLDLKAAEDDDIMRWSSKRTVPIEMQDESESGGYNNSMPRSESQLFPAMMMIESDDEFYDAEDGFKDEKPTPSPVPVQLSQTDELLVLVDSACPAWLDMCSSRGTYIHVYAITRGNKTVFRLAQACEDLIAFASEFVQVVDEHFSPRISSSERTRRVLGLMLSKAGHTEQVKSFMSQESILADLFLKRPLPSMSDKERSVVEKCGLVARAISDRHWVEEWVKITTRAIFFFSPEKRKPHFRVTLQNIVGVERLDPELNPHFQQYFFLVIETSGRSVYLMFGNDKERDSWLDLISNLKQSGQDDSDSLSSNESARSARLLDIGNPAEEYMHKSSLWNCKHRRLLNCRRFSFSCQTGGDANQLVETALVHALESSKDAFDDYGRRGAFLDSAAALKQASVHGLPEDARLTFFLNLYHVMIIHAFLVLGPPNSSLNWISYFNNIAYQVSDDIFSLTELEHCIIRAKMSYPSQFLSRFVIPKSPYQIAMTKGDFRINFALNCGSLSNPATIFIYRVDQLDRQLDVASKLYLQRVTGIRKSARDVFIQLPKICQWYSTDFGSNESLITKLAPHLQPDVRQMLGTCWLSQQRRFDLSGITIRYLPFSFECRLLSLEQSSTSTGEDGSIDALI